MLSGVAGKPLWLICEDGTEYWDRFTRFLSSEFAFAQARDAGALLDQLGRMPARGVLLDLDFRRTPAAALVDEVGRPGASPRLAPDQGIFIARLLRARGLAVPILLFADLESPEQVAFLEQGLRPLSVVPSQESLADTAARMRLR